MRSSAVTNKSQRADVAPVHVLSLGAGVQSSTMALMAARGAIKPMPSAAVFADTGAEPASVYEWLGWLEGKLPFPVYRVTGGNLTVSATTMRVTSDNRRYAKTSIPVFTRNHDGERGKVPFRSCTRDFKIRPLLNLQRRIGKIARGQTSIGVISWIGISIDEATRMKPSREQWLANRYPLIEQRMNRADCLRWMEDQGYPRPPRSACVFCPFHNDAEWRRLKIQEPEEFAKAVAFERELQAAKAMSDNFRTTPFLHRSLIPLGEVDFATPEERGQLNFFQNECEGMCGV